MAEPVTEKKFQGRTFWRLIGDTRERPVAGPDLLLPSMDGDNDLVSEAPESTASVASVESVDASGGKAESANPQELAPGNADADSDADSHTCDTFHDYDGC